MGKASRRKRDNPERQARLVRAIKARGGPQTILELIDIRMHDAMEAMVSRVWCEPTGGPAGLSEVLRRSGE
jgi:hypothetical protein